MKFDFWNFVILSTSLVLAGLDVQGNELKCGMRQQISQSETVPTIINGTETTEGQWPWHVAIFHSFQYVCGGSIISKTYVLTAAHCTLHRKNRQKQNVKNIFVDAGTHDLFTFYNRQRHSVKSVSIFDNYTWPSHQYDIAILELDTELKFDQYVQPVCVSLEQNLVNKVGTVVGWGLTEFDTASTILREARLPVVDTMTCLNSDHEAFGPTLKRQMFCAGYTNGTGVCNGDSGGGLFFEINGVWYLGGIVSFTRARDENKTMCYTKGYGVFTKIHDFLSWIREHTHLKHLIGEGEPRSKRTCVAINATATNTDVRKLPRQCGVYYPNRMFRGQRTRVFEFPWMALLIHASGYWQKVGTLINNRYILTGALPFLPRHVVKARLGEHMIGQTIDCNEDEDCAPPVQDIDIQCIIYHPRTSRSRWANDIALLRLAEHVEFKDHIQPICLPTKPILRKMEPPRYILTGWGATEEEDESPVLLKGFISTIDLAGCQMIARNISTEKQQIVIDNQFCSESTHEAAASYGDHGAPVGYTIKHNGIRFVQFGIFSFSLRYFNGSRYHVYTNVSSYMDWILANIVP
uniref:Putative trypsin-like serine protease n=1 Tax=Aedes albopictus TaxID=7160 RepID=A0A1W7R7X0_AEDAL